MHDKTMELLTFNKYHSFEKNFVSWDTNRGEIFRDSWNMTLQNARSVILPNQRRTTRFNPTKTLNALPPPVYAEALFCRVMIFIRRLFVFEKKSQPSLNAKQIVFKGIYFVQ